MKLIKNVLTHTECKELIRKTETHEKLEYLKTYNSATKMVSVDDVFNRRQGVEFMQPYVSELKASLLNLLNEQKIYKGIVYDKILSFKFNKYQIGDFLNYHSDMHEIQYGATLTMVVQLNEDYEGGEFCYLDNGVEKEVEKSEGSIIIFESNIPHKVNPIIKGVRYSYNVWPKYTKGKASLI